MPEVQIGHAPPLRKELVRGAAGVHFDAIWRDHAFRVAARSSSQLDIVP